MSKHHLESAYMHGQSSLWYPTETYCSWGTGMSELEKCLVKYPTKNPEAPDEYVWPVQALYIIGCDPIENSSTGNVSGCSLKE